VLSTGVKDPSPEHHVMPVQPGATAPYSAAALAPGLSSMAANGSAGLAPSFMPALSEPVNAPMARRMLQLSPRAAPRRVSRLPPLR
jgi:hypothetical protein